MMLFSNYFKTPYVKPVFFLFLFASVFFFHCKISNLSEAQFAVKDRFLDKAADNDQVRSATLLVHSDKLNIHWKESHGSVLSNGQAIPTHPDQPFHTASVGKLFTAVLIMQLVEKGSINLSAKAMDHLPKGTLNGLYVIDGKDYQDQVLIEHLLSHTSGVADYFESTDKEHPEAKAVIHEITANPDKFWTPDDLLDFTRKFQKPIGLPGKQFLYSDTGYVILGKIIEHSTKQSFETVLKERFFKPLSMNHTYMHLRSSPIQKTNLALSPILLEGKDVTNFRSVSADWAGGGLISTTEDLLKFHKALIANSLISKKSLDSMSGTNKFMDGIYYGLGVMTVRFGDMLFLMKGTPDLMGHSGILGTHLFYTPEYDTFIIANFGSSQAVGDSFEMLFRIMSILKDVNSVSTKK
jgi:D-alanyl-D-alanine carboxypeptidase